METMDMQAIVKFVHEIVPPIDPPKPTPTPTPTPPEYVDPVTGAVNAATSGTGDPLSWLFIALIVIATLGALYLFASKKLEFSFRHATATPVGAHVAPTPRYSSSQKKRKKAASKLGFFAIVFCAVVGIAGIGTQAISANAANANNATDAESAQITQATNDDTQEKAVFTITKSDEGKTVITGNDQPIIAHVYDDGTITYDNFTLKNETGDFVEVSKTKLQSLIEGNNANWTFTIANANDTVANTNETNTNQIYNGLAYAKGEEVTQRSWTRIEKDQSAEIEVTSTLDHTTVQTLYDKETVKLGLDAMIHPVEVTNNVEDQFTILDINKDPYTDNIIKVPQGEDLDFYIDKEEGKGIEVIWSDKEGTTKKLTPGAEEKYTVKWEDIENEGKLTIYEAYSVVVSLGGGTLDTSSKITGWTYDEVNKNYYKTYKAGTEVSSVEAEWSHDKAYITNTSEGKAWARYNPDKWDSTFKTKYVDMKGGVLTLLWQEGVFITRNTVYKDYLTIADSQGVAYSEKEWKENKMIVAKGEFSFKVNVADSEKEKNPIIVVKKSDGRAYDYDASTGLYSANLTSNEEINTYEYLRVTLDMAAEGADIKSGKAPTSWTKVESSNGSSNDNANTSKYYKDFLRYVDWEGYKTTGAIIKADWPNTTEAYPTVKKDSDRNYQYTNHWFTGFNLDDTYQLTDNKEFKAEWGEKGSAAVTVTDNNGKTITKDSPLTMSIKLHDESGEENLPSVYASYNVDGEPYIEFEQKDVKIDDISTAKNIFTYESIGFSGTKGDPEMTHKIETIRPLLTGGTDDLTGGVYTYSLSYPETDNFQSTSATYYIKIEMLEADFTLAYESTKGAGKDTIDMPYDSSAANNLTWDNRKTTDDIIKDYELMTAPEIKDAKVITSQGKDISSIILIRYNMAHSKNQQEQEQIDMSLINVAPNLEGSAEEQAAVKAAILQLVKDGDTTFTVTFCLPKSPYYKKTSEHTFNVNITKADSDIIIEDGDDYYADETVEQTGPEEYTEYRNIYIYSSSDTKTSTANVRVKTNANASLKKEGSDYQVTLKNDEEGTKDPRYSSMDKTKIKEDTEAPGTFIIPVVAGTSASGTSCDWLTVPFDETSTSAEIVAAAKTFKFRVFVKAKKATLSGLNDKNIELGATITQDINYVGVSKASLPSQPTVKIYDGAETDVTSTYFESVNFVWKSGEASNQVWTLTIKAKVYTDIEKKNIVPLGDYKVKIEFPEDSTSGWNAVGAESTLTVTKQTPNNDGYDPTKGIDVKVDVWATKTTSFAITNAPSTYDMAIADNTVVTSSYDVASGTITTDGLKATNTDKTTPAKTTGVLSFPETAITNAASFNINYTVNKVSKTAQWSTQPKITQANVDYRIACDKLAYTGDALQNGDEEIQLGIKDAYGNFTKIDNSKVTYDTAFNELVVMCPTAMTNTTAYIKFPETANCKAAVTADGETGVYGTIIINITRQQTRNLKLYEVGSKRNEIEKDESGNYIISLTKKGTEASVTASAQARFNGDDNAPSDAEFKTNSTTGITVDTDDNVIGTFVCTVINEYTITYSLDRTDEYEAASVTLKIKFTRTVSPDEDLEKYLEANDGITLAGSGITSTETPRPDPTAINTLEVHPTVSPAAGGTNTWTATSSDDTIATATVTEATTASPTITISAVGENASGERTAYITIKVTDSSITNDPGATTTIKVNVLPDYAYRKYSYEPGNGNDSVDVYSVVKNYQTTKTDISPNKTIEITNYNKDASTNKYSTKSYTLNGIGVVDINTKTAKAGALFTKTVTSVNLNNLDEVYIAPYVFCGVGTDVGNYFPIESFSTKTGAIRSLGSNAFSYCTKLGYFDFASCTSLTKIPEKAFNYCKSLSDVTLPSTITSISGGAFDNCTSLKSIDLSAMDNSGGVTIGQTTAESFTPGETFERSNGAFSNCTSVETIKMPSALTQIGRYSFYNNSSVTSITGMNAENIYYGAFSGCKALKELDLSASTSLVTITYTGPTGAAITGEATASTDYGSFANCNNLELITMPGRDAGINKTLLMNGYSFAYDYSLKYMTIHHTNKVTTKNNDFYGCKQLRNFVLCQTSNVGNEISSNMLQYTYKGNSGSQTRVPLMCASYSRDNDTTLKAASNVVDYGDAGSCQSLRKETGTSSGIMTYTPISGNEIESVESYRYYYLTGNVTPKVSGEAWNMGEQVYYSFDLNGHELGNYTETNKHCFKINNKETYLRIDDSYSLSEDSVGKLTGCQVTGNGGAIWCDHIKDYKLFFVNGNITGNTAAGAEGGGGLQVNGNGDGRPNFYMFDGWITDNKTTTDGKSGGGVYLGSDAYMYQYGGCIKGNIATNNGGGVYTSSDDGTAGKYKLYPGATCINNYCNSTALGGVYDKQNGGRFEPQIGTTEGVDYYNERVTHETTSNFTYELTSDNKGLILTGYTGTDTTATVPEYDYHTTSSDETYYLPVVQAGDGNAISSGKTGVTLSFAENSQVTTVNKNAFSNSGFSSVTLPSTVTTINEGAFAGNINLTNVDISKTGITTLPKDTFNGCTELGASTSNISLPSNLTTIGESAFNGCTSLENIDFLPAAVNTLQKTSFTGAGIKTLNTSKWTSLQIGETAFQNCTSLTKAEIVNGCTVGKNAFNNCTNLVNLTVNTTGDIAESAFSGCTKLATVDINCNNIASYAFLGCDSITSLKVVAKTISDGAFASATLPSLQAENGAQSAEGKNLVSGLADESDAVSYDIQANTFGKYVLYKRNAITNLNIMLGGVGNSAATCNVVDNAFAYTDDSATSGICELNISKTAGGTLGSNMFDGSKGIKSADFSSTDITTVPNSMFANCAYLDTVYWNKALQIIGNSAFINCVSYSDLNMSWADNLQEIQTGAFSGCTGITDIYLEENYNLKTIGDNAFSGLTKLKYLDLPSGTKASSFTSIGAQAFMNCAALVGDYDTDRLDISSSITSLGKKCFSGCTALRSVNFEGNGTNPGALTTVGDETFGGCTAISEIDFSNTKVTTLHEDADVGAMFGCTNLRKLTLPATYNAPISPGDYGKSENITEVDMSRCTLVTEFSANVFKDKKKLTTIDLPKTGCAVTKIGDYAFSGCSALKTFGFEYLGQLTTIGNYAFNYCTALASVDTTNLTKLSKIEDYAFYYCTSLASFDFTKLTALVDVVSQEAITPALGAYSFANCSALTTVDFSNNTQIYVIPEGCFQHCTGLTNLVLPNNIKRVEAYAFYGDTKLNNVDFNPLSAAPDDLTIEYVGHDAFKNTAHFKNTTYITEDGIVFDKSKVVAMGVATGTVAQRLELEKTTRVVAAYCLENCSSLRWLIIDETDGHKIYMNDYCITNCPNMTNLVVKQRKSTEGEAVDNDNIVWGDNVLENAGSVGKSDSEHAIVPMVVTGGANTKAKFSSYAGVSAYTYYPILCSPSTSFPALQDKYYYYLDGDETSLQVSSRINSSGSADCVLDLNGHNLTRGLTSQVPYGQVISFSGNSLRLDDSSTNGDGSITKGMSTWKTFSVQDASYGGGVYVSKSGVSLYFVRGIIANCTAFQGGGIYIQNQAKVYMYDGAEISGCQATYNKYMWGGGAIMMAHHSEFYMHGGKIHDCRAYNEGGAILANCRGWNTFKMRLYDGQFYNNYIGTSGTKRNDITAGTGWTGHYDLKGNLKKNVDYIFREDHWV